MKNYANWNSRRYICILDINRYWHCLWSFVCHYRYCVLHIYITYVCVGIHSSASSNCALILIMLKCIARQLIILTKKLISFLFLHVDQNIIYKSLYNVSSINFDKQCFWRGRKWRKRFTRFTQLGTHVRRWEIGRKFHDVSAITFKSVGRMRTNDVEEDEKEAARS